MSDQSSTKLLTNANITEDLISSPARIHEEIKLASKEAELLQNLSNKPRRQEIKREIIILETAIMGLKRSDKLAALACITDQNLDAQKYFQNKL